MDIMNYIYRSIGLGKVYVFHNSGHLVYGKIWGGVGDISTFILVILSLLPDQKRAHMFFWHMSA